MTKLPTMNINPILGANFIFHISNQVITLIRKYNAKIVAKRGRLYHRLMMVICACEIETTWVI